MFFFLIECATIEESVVDHLVRDTGIGPNDDQYDALKTKVFKGPDDKTYKDLWILAKKYVVLLKKSKDRFPRCPSNRTCASLVQEVCGMIFELRNITQNKDVLNQELLHKKFVSLWRIDNKSGGPTMSDKSNIWNYSN